MLRVPLLANNRSARKSITANVPIVHPDPRKASSASGTSPLSLVDIAGVITLPRRLAADSAPAHLLELKRTLRAACPDRFSVSRQVPVHTVREARLLLA